MFPRNYPQLLFAPDELVCRAQQALEMERKIATPITVDERGDEAQNSSGDLSIFTRDDYGCIKEALAAIHSGEVFQLVLSLTFYHRIYR